MTWCAADARAPRCAASGLDADGAGGGRTLTSQMQSDAMRVQIDRMRLRQVQAQLGVVPHFEGGPLAVRGVHTHTRKQHVTTPCMHMCEACAQPPPRSADAALPAGVPVERTTRVCIIDGRE